MRSVHAVVAALALVPSLVAFASSALAQAWPAKPVRILVAFAPGGPSDVAARLVSAKLTEVWNQQVLVENRPGGNGFIAMGAAAKAPPDGYTLMMATVGEVAVVPALYKEAPYNVQKDFMPITLVSDVPIAFATHVGMPFRTIGEVVTAAKASPGTLSVSLPGNGTANHIVLEWLALATGSRFQPVPYKGSGPGAAALAGGEVALAMLAQSSLTPHVKSGKVRILGLASARRSSLSPELPTFEQEGVAEVSGSTWTALLAPAGTPQPVVDRINADVVRILGMADVKERFAAGGAETIPSTPAELDARIRRDAAQFGAVVQRANIKPD
jgi:tripartite-type tricarboxylate transporter receptor subunit TctC